MVAEFEEGEIHFRYPESGQLEREENDSGWTVSLQSPGTAFFLLSVNEDMPSTDQVAEQALSALREVYPDLEAEDRAEPFAGQPAVGHDIHFFSLDLTNTCWTRSFYTSQGTALVLCQTSDLELDTNEPVLRAICASLEVADE
jgi:hypothetical protein